jgi:hypothetical protein
VHKAVAAIAHFCESASKRRETSRRGQRDMLEWIIAAFAAIGAITVIDFVIDVARHYADGAE